MKLICQVYNFWIENNINNVTNNIYFLVTQIYNRNYYVITMDRNNKDILNLKLVRNPYIFIYIGISEDPGQIKEER